jgi:hypothetical protein
VINLTGLAAYYCACQHIEQQSVSILTALVSLTQRQSAEYGA